MRPTRPRKSSASITLVLISSVVMHGCGPDPGDGRGVRRDVYSSLEDCRAEWDRADNCERVSSTGSRWHSSSGHHFYGPRYTWHDTPTSGGDPKAAEARPRPGSRALGIASIGGSSASGGSRSGFSSSSGTASSSRGGFGGSASAHGGGS